MFKDVGKEIKRLAEKYFTSAVIPFVIIAIAVFAVLAYMNYAVIGLVAAVIIVLLKYASAKREVMLLYGYGELIDRIQSIEEHIVPKTVSNESDTSKTRKTIVRKVDAPKTDRNPDGSWTCVFCERLNHADAKWCGECGCEAKFD